MGYSFPTERQEIKFSVQNLWCHGADRQALGVYVPARGGART